MPEPGNHSVQDNTVTYVMAKLVIFSENIA